MMSMLIFNTGNEFCHKRYVLFCRNLDNEELQVPLPSLNAPKFLAQNDLKGQCYAGNFLLRYRKSENNKSLTFIGISLPKNLLDMFPSRNLSRTYVSQDIRDQDLMDLNLLTSKQQHLNDSLYNEGEDESSVISSLSDVSSVSKRSKWTGSKHARSNCLHCCRLRRLHRSLHKNRSEAGTCDLSSTASLCEIYNNASAVLVAAGMQATVALARKGGSSSATGTVSNKHSLLHLQNQQQQPQLSNNSSIMLSDLQFHSPESILSEESLPDKLTANILYNVQRLANPVSAKQSKMALLELKQKHPASFQDICLYSEVCRTLGRCSYRMNSRRFLQELFLDLDFDSFYNEPLDIISKKERESLTNPENKERLIGSDKLALLKERMKRDLNSCGSRPDNNSSESKLELSQTAATGNNNVIAIGSQPLKSHIKSQPLASVYEASCENLLLDPSPHIKSLLSSGKYDSKQNYKTFIVAPPPAAPPPLNQYDTELKITSDDEEENANPNEGNYYRQKIQQSSDEVDGAFVRSSSSANSLNPVSTAVVHSNTGFSSQNNIIQMGGGISTPNSSSNCSDQTSTSNRSSTCTISHQPLSNNSYLPTSNPITSAPFVKPIENENTKFRRGRFYTLELDLSCTKNKFPITDRTKVNINSPLVQKVATERNSAATITSPSKVPATSNSLLRQHSLGSDCSSSYKLPILRSSQMTDQMPTASNINTASTSRDNNDPKYLITKSLAASLAQPIGTLYCEKRLQSSKSEAVLIQTPLFVTVTSGSIPSTANSGSHDVSSVSNNKIGKNPCSLNYETQ